MPATVRIKVEELLDLIASGLDSVEEDGYPIEYVADWQCEIEQDGEEVVVRFILPEKSGLI